VAFVNDIQVPGVEVRRLFDNVRDDVMDMTRRRQQPYSYGSVPGRQDFYFTPKGTFRFILQVDPYFEYGNEIDFLNEVCTIIVRGGSAKCSIAHLIGHEF
jgi:hypothetical protein